MQRRARTDEGDAYGSTKETKDDSEFVYTDLGALTKTIELDHFSLFASHLIISVTWSSVKLAAELKLNSSSYSGQLPGVLLDSCTSILGLYSNKYVYGSPSLNTDIN